jgi:Ca2+-binding EF-hand superfamily protein
MRSYITASIFIAAGCALSLRAEEKPMPTADQAKMMAEMQQRMLQQFDVNKDGVLSDQEKLAAQEAMLKQGVVLPGMTPAGFPGADQMLKQFDKDGDGKLNAVEQMAAMTAYQRARKNGGGPTVGRLPYGPGMGQAGQGALPAAQGNEAKGDEGKKVNALIKRFDKDGDGKLDKDEKAAAQAELKKKNAKADKK